MRLVRIGAPGVESPGLLDAEGNLRDARPWVDDWRSAALTPDFLADLCQRDVSPLPLITAPVRFGPCVAGVGKIIGVALNYQLHAAETGARPTTEPNLFLKATSALSGADDPIPMPRGGSKLDWEVELGVIIGRTAVNITAVEASNVIAGYCLLDDVSERTFQIERGGQQHTKGKSAAGFCPIGPWLLTVDAVTDPQAIRLWTVVNGVRMQDGSTAQMSVGVYDLVAYCSDFMTLEPGDIIATGTPAGVGHGMKPPCYLAVGDTVMLGGTDLGEQHHRITALD